MLKFVGVGKLHKNFLMFTVRIVNNLNSKLLKVWIRTGTNSKKPCKIMKKVGLQNRDDHEILMFKLKERH